MSIPAPFEAHEHPLWRVEDWFTDKTLEYCHAYMHRVRGPIGVHASEFLELNILVEGSARHCVNGSVYEAERGAVYVIPSGTRHGYHSEKGASILHVLIHSDFLRAYDCELHALPGYTMLFEVDPYLRSGSRSSFSIRLTEAAYDSLRGIIQALLEHERSRYPGRETLKNASLLSLVGQLCAYTHSFGASMMRASDDPNALIIARSMEYIRLNAAKKLTIEGLAREACMGRSTFIRNFTRVCGRTPMQFLMQCRMAMARKELCYSGKSVTDVALECGFYDTSHFIHVFMKNEGYTPADFRALYAQKASYTLCSICARPPRLTQA